MPRRCAPLSVGDPAPKLMVQEFVRGEPVAEFERGKVYVIEFWKCGCPPCRAAIPHLNELQKKYHTVTFIGVGVISPLAMNKEYAKQSGDQMIYRVAIDRVPPGKHAETGGEMVQNWLKPAGEEGVPTAFIVDGDGRIAWIGHPMKLDDAKAGNPLECIVAGKWDLKAAASKHASQRGLDEAWRRVDRLPELEREAVKAIQKLAGRVVVGCRDNRVSFVQVSQSRMTDAVLANLLKELAKLKGLEDLELCNTEVTDTGLKLLRGLTNVKYLDLRGTKVTGAGLGELREWKDLQVLDLRGCRVTEDGFRELKSLKSIKTLLLSGVPMTAAGFEQLKELPELHVLHVANTGLTDCDLQVFQSMRELHGLDLSDNPISDVGLRELKGLELGFLRLNNTRVEGLGLADVSDQLVVLILAGIPIADSALSELKRFPNLNHLDLAETQVTDAGLALLSHNPKLEFLSLIDTRVTDKGLRNLRDLKGLGRLELRGTAVTDAGLTELKHLKELNWLDVARTKVTKEAIAGLKAALPDLEVAY